MMQLCRIFQSEYGLRFFQVSEKTNFTPLWAHNWIHFKYNFSGCSHFNSLKQPIIYSFLFDFVNWVYFFCSLTQTTFVCKVLCQELWWAQ